MIVRVNKLEVSSEVAQVMLKYLEDNNHVTFPNGIFKEENGVTSYTEEAQDVFNELYDVIDNVIDECKVVDTF